MLSRNPSYGPAIELISSWSSTPSDASDLSALPPDVRSLAEYAWKCIARSDGGGALLALCSGRIPDATHSASTSAAALAAATAAAAEDVKILLSGSVRRLRPEPALLVAVRYTVTHP